MIILISVSVSLRYERRKFEFQNQTKSDRIMQPWVCKRMNSSRSWRVFRDLQRSRSEEGSEHWPGSKAWKAPRVRGCCSEIGLQEVGAVTRWFVPHLRPSLTDPRKPCGLLQRPLNTTTKASGTLLNQQWNVDSGSSHLKTGILTCHQQPLKLVIVIAFLRKCLGEKPDVCVCVQMTHTQKLTWNQ